MAAGRSLAKHEHIGGHQYRLRIQNHAPFSDNQWFTFDKRTKSIRYFKDRKFAISNQAGHQHRPRFAAVVRPWANEPFQKITFWSGKKATLRNHANLCLDVWGNKDVHRQHTTFYHCHLQNNQLWLLDTKGTHFPKYPLKDGERFQIKTQMKSGRALIYTEHLGNHQYRLRIRNTTPENIKQWWIFD